MRIDATVLAELRAGSEGPVCAYVYDLAGLAAHAAAAVAALPPAAELFYAAKANSAAPIVAALAGVVAGFEVGSAGEIVDIGAHRAISAGPKVGDDLGVDHRAAAPAGDAGITRFTPPPRG